MAPKPWYLCRQRRVRTPESRGITALHDPTEGGLATSVRELAEASGCGAILRAADIPVLNLTATISRHLDLDPLGLLASGCLLAAANPESVATLMAAASVAEIHLAVCGTLTPAEEGFILDNGANAPLPTFAADEVTRVLSRDR